MYRSHNGIYYALVKVAGKQIKRSLKTADEALAKRRLSEFRGQATRLTADSEEKKLMFDDVAGRWLKMIATQLQPSSYSRRKVCVNQLLPFFRGSLMRNIGERQIENWRLARTPQLSARSFNIELETLRLIFEYAKEDLRIILENPAGRLKRKKQIKKALSVPTKKEFAVLVGEMRKLTKAAEAADFVEFLAYSGLRLGEAIHVRWADVAFESARLTVSGGETGTKNSEYRVIPLFPPLAALLQTIRERRPPAVGDKIFSIENAKKAIGSACRRANLPHWGHHAMRHFFCSNAIEAGIDFKVIAGWLGHKDGGVLVAKTYGHLRAEHSAAMAQRMTFAVAAVAEGEMAS
jgi:integrase